MPWDTDPQSNNQLYNSSNAPGRNDKAKRKTMIMIGVGIFLTVAILLLIFSVSTPESQQSKYQKSATLAAQKYIPDAKVSNLKVAGGFAIATVSDPSASSQANAGSETVFRVNKDGSMVQVATGSSFSPLDLLELGIPLATQAKLSGSNLASVEKNLANQCGYSNGSIGYIGFNGSFNPGGWQIDSATFSQLDQKLSSVISKQNANANQGKAVICVNATPKNSSVTTDKTTYISNFSLQVQFISKDGTLTTHTVSFAVGPNYYHSYSLDGRTI